MQHESFDSDDQQQQQQASVSNLHGIILTSFSSFVFNSNFFGNWIVDSGATHHVCSGKNLFISFLDIPSSISVALPTESVISVTTIGSISLLRTLIISNVLYIPSFKFKILSVSSLASTHSISALFHTNSCILQDLNKKVIGTAKRIENLYILESFTVDNSLCSNVVSMDLWHTRLGHPSNRIKSLFPSLNNTDVQYDVCHICPLAKQKKLPFILNPKLSTAPFDLVHLDI